MEAACGIQSPVMSGNDQLRPITLASQSPRRAMILRDAGIEFQVIVPQFEEPDHAEWRFGPEEFAESASYYKARDVAEERPYDVILAADTVVAMDGELFGKPRDEADARRILSRLAGSTHQVITGVTLFEPTASRRLICHDVTQVRMRRLSDDELNAYLATRQWEGKAGAYGIQDEHDPFVEAIEGSFTNVVGLPIELVRDMLTTFGILTPAGV